MTLQTSAMRGNGAEAPAIAPDSDSDEDISAGKRGDAKYKIQITLNNRQKNSLFHLKDETGVESAAQVVRDSLRVYEYLVEQLLAGQRELSIRDMVTNKETVVKLI